MKLPGNRVLVAGIGNIFKGDDAFGVEVIRHLRVHHDIPDEVRVHDFGIRGYDLAYAIGDAYEAVILVDAAPRGETPGTLYLLELDTAQLGEDTSEANVDPHTLDPVSVLRLVHALSRSEDTGKLYLIGCEPAVLDSSDGSLELSPLVAAAIPAAAEMIRSHLAKQFNIHLAPSSRLIGANN
jgi:hydrogenase maturation protease